MLWYIWFWAFQLYHVIITKVYGIILLQCFFTVAFWYIVLPVCFRQRKTVKGPADLGCRATPGTALEWDRRTRLKGLIYESVAHDRWSIWKLKKRHYMIFVTSLLYTSKHWLYEWLWQRKAKSSFNQKKTEMEGLSLISNVL